MSRSTPCERARERAVAHDDVQAELIRLLERRIPASADKEIVRRANELRSLFDGLNQAQAKSLHARLRQKTDYLSQFFDCELATWLRDELRETAKEKAEGDAGEGSSAAINSKDRGDEERGIADRSTPEGRPNLPSQRQKEGERGIQPSQKESTTSLTDDDTETVFLAPLEESDESFTDIVEVDTPTVQLSGTGKLEIASSLIKYFVDLYEEVYLTDLEKEMILWSIKQNVWPKIERHKPELESKIQRLRSDKSSLPEFYLNVRFSLYFERIKKPEVSGSPRRTPSFNVDFERVFKEANFESVDVTRKSMNEITETEDLIYTVIYSKKIQVELTPGEEKRLQEHYRNERSEKVERRFRSCVESGWEQFRSKNEAPPYGVPSKAEQKRADRAAEEIKERCAVKSGFASAVSVGDIPSNRAREIWDSVP